MSNSYTVSVLRNNVDPLTLGTMNEKAITFNRYNKGLLIAAGKLLGEGTQNDAFLTFAAKFRNKACMRFQGDEKTYFGDFCFINFIPETHTVVFGSIGPVMEVDTASLDDIDDLQNIMHTENKSPHTNIDGGVTINAT